MIPEIKKILYASDLTKNAAYAFFYAADIAKKYNAHIVFLHAIETMNYVYVGDEDEVYAQLKGMEELKALREKARKTGAQEIKKRIEAFCKRSENQMGNTCVGLVSKILVPMGHPIEEILNAADEENCDLIVLGTHGKGFLKQTFLGSVAGSVLERTRKPVFIVPLPTDANYVNGDTV